MANAEAFSIQGDEMSSKVRVLLRGNHPLSSGGVQAMVLSSAILLKKYIPDLNLTVVSHYPEVERQIYKRNGLDLRIVWVKEGTLKSFQRFLRAILWAGFQKLKLNVACLLRDDLLMEFAQSDVVIYLLADALSYDISRTGTILVPIENSFDVLLAWLLRKPSILFPFSAGPFPNRLVSLFARFALNRTAVVMTREELTRDYLVAIGVRKDIRVVADVAFGLQPAPDEQIARFFHFRNLGNCHSSLIGINISQLMSHRSRVLNLRNDYIELMARLADYLVDEFNVTVLLIPHQIYPKTLEFTTDTSASIQLGTDMTAISDTFARVKNKDRIVPLNGEYTVQELKGIISKCDLFVGARTHSIIAAISTSVPTLGIAYSVKTIGIMKMFHLDEYVCDLKSMNLDELTTKVGDLWRNRDKIRKKLSAFAKSLTDSNKSIAQSTIDVLTDTNITEEFK